MVSYVWYDVTLKFPRNVFRGNVSSNPVGLQERGDIQISGKGDIVQSIL